MKHVLYLLIFVLLMGSAFILAGCKHSKKTVINTVNMPGRVVQKLKEEITTEPAGQSVERKSNGVYIIHSGDVTNNTGVNFNTIPTHDIRIGEVQFDAEKFATKY